MDNDGRKSYPWALMVFKMLCNSIRDTFYLQEIVDARLTIISLNFERGNRWQFMYNGFKISMIVKDDALMERIDEGDRFGKGDSIRVKMLIVKQYNPAYKAYENKSYKIIEFIEHILSPIQGRLFEE